MEKAWTPPVRWVFLAATVLGLFSTLQSYRLTMLTMKDGYSINVGRILILNLVYWYVPAILTSPIFRLTHRFRATAQHWVKPTLIHVTAAILFSFVHLGAMLGVRSFFWARSGKSPIAALSAASVQTQYLQNLDWTLMTYAAIVGMAYALAFNRESQGRAVKAAQLETRLAEARLQTLQAELHPHFLFNTLHAISTLVHSKPDADDRMISRLSDLLRLTFDRSGAAGVSLQQELEFLQKYLEIEQLRFQDRLSVRFDIAPETLDAEVPRLILQPLVENAIKHGVSPRTGPGLIQIAAKRQAETLQLEVQDDGVGLSATARNRLNAGIGLSNTRDRLECLYGTRHRLDFSEGCNGLAVRIEIPFHHAPRGSDTAASRVA